MRITFSILKNNISRFAIFALFLILWQTIQISSSWSLLNGEQARNRQFDVIRQVAPEIIKPGDIVFLSSQNAPVLQVINQLGATVYEFDAADTAGFEAGLIKALDIFCNPDKEHANLTAYFIWTFDNEKTIMELGNAARGFKFYFDFQALMSNTGSNAFAIDKFLRLQPKENLIRRYCEANKITGSKPVMLVIDANDFSPWIGSMKTGRISWLASDPERQLENSDFTVIDMPPLITYDVYWMGQLYIKPYWSFENQDMAAYQQSVQQTKAQNGIVLVDRQSKLGL